MVTTPIENTPAAWSARASAMTSWEACGWSERGQRVRHETVVDRLAPAPGEILLDYGCGTGDLSDRVAPGVVYRGYDWAAGMASRAARSHEGRTITTTEPDEPVDLVACIGPFNLPGGWSKDRTWETVARLWQLCTRAMAVSLYAGEDDRCLIYEPGEVAEAAAALSHSFTVERGYLPNDVLAVLRR